MEHFLNLEIVSLSISLVLVNQQRFSLFVTFMHGRKSNFIDEVIGRKSGLYC